jgi:hypothetical protein
MIRSAYHLFAITVMLAGCTRRTPVVPESQPMHSVRLYDGGTPLPAGMRLAIQFNNEPAIIQVADGRGGLPILYHGRELKPDQLKSIIILKRKEAQERFGDQTLHGAILIELK